ncbi:MAG: hypothetical protein R2879_05565 [Saprospiraceae bacterium]
MKNIKYYLLGLFCLAMFGAAQAHIGPGTKKAPAKRAVQNRGGDCAPATANIDQEINNVRARLLNGGDVWWDGDNGRYIVPKVAAGQPEVSSLFAGAVWIGGFDPGGNLKIAAQTYGTAQGNTDFWPGPLDPFTGGVDKATCTNWDRFFKVTAAEIREHLRNVEAAEAGEIAYTEDMIPQGVKGWPAKGNPYFFDVWNFDLPNTGQGLAGFFEPGDSKDGIYDPLQGDFPIIEIIGCSDFDLPNDPDVPQFADEMIFWIYNDNGGVHTESQGDAIQMEVQVQTFAYATNDFINDMTFQRYKLINRATEDITSCYFSMWVDPDLGCYTDDYIGCDTARSLMFVYNQDATDGQTGCSCPGGVNTYCTDVPILGVDYFRGPKGRIPVIDSITGDTVIDPLTGLPLDTLVELGMSSFTYYNNPSVGNPQPGTTDPQTANEFYNYITGRWRDGSAFQFGGTGYNTGGEEIDYAFPSNPSCSDGDACWSMCTEGLGEGDRRTLQATGPFTLKPGDVNELIVGVVWIPKEDYPCPDITNLRKADDVSQALFDNCFEITDGPDAPDVDWIELDKEIIGILTNDEQRSNNAFEAYAQEDLQAPKSLPEEEKLYRFEGYKVFQLVSPNVSRNSLTDPTQAKLVFQSDIDNGVGKIFNWEAVDNPNDGQPNLWVPEEQVLASNPDRGLRHTFRITEDLFTRTTNTRLVNHKKYYFIAIAYAHNNYELFDPYAGGGVGAGQPRPYIEGRKGADGGAIKIYTVIPRPIGYEVLQSEYGDGAEITRIDGRGAGGHFLDMIDESRENIINNNYDGTITYKEGRGPFEITVFNPLDVKDGTFELSFYDENMNNAQLDQEVRWRLKNLDNPSEVIEAERTIDQLNEQILPSYGFSITIKDGLLPGNNENGVGDPANGAIGYEEVYSDDLAGEWLTGLPSSGLFGRNPLMLTGPNQEDNALDPSQAYTQLGPGTWYPYYLLNYRADPTGFGYVSPVWPAQGGLVRQQMDLEDLNNVDIVFTSDKSKWSRCVVVETTSPSMISVGLETLNNANHFDTRRDSSVTKDDLDNDGFPDVDKDDGIGMGWFPGYAIDVETGQRLNIFFGEASIYRCDEPTLQAILQPCENGLFLDGNPTGADMMFNPTSQDVLLNVPQGFQGPWQGILGGNHNIYVTKQPYDSCKIIRSNLQGASPLLKARALREVTWTTMPYLNPGFSMRSYKDGLIPNDLIVKLRVDHPFEVFTATGENNGYPRYEFTLNNRSALEITTEEQFDEALANINVVPNPYYGFSAYENSPFSTVVKITNLPAKCEVSIYSLDGKFIRRYNRDEQGIVPDGNNRAIAQSQIYPDLEWDLKNNKGIPVASGIYLIHVKAPGYGERVLKWFGIPRQYDPTGL